MASWWPPDGLPITSRSPPDPHLDAPDPNGQTRTSILLSNWGAVSGLGGVPTERCFDATRDLVIPGVLHDHIVAKVGCPPECLLIASRI